MGILIQGCVMVRHRLSCLTYCSLIFYAGQVSRCSRNRHCVPGHGHRRGRWGCLERGTIFRIEEIQGTGYFSWNGIRTNQLLLTQYFENQNHFAASCIPRNHSQTFLHPRMANLDLYLNCVIWQWPCKVRNLLYCLPCICTRNFSLLEISLVSSQES